MSMHEVRAMIIRHEGLPMKDGRCYPYRCSEGKLTIGVGRNIEDRGISQDEAFMMLDNDIAECVIDLSANLSWFGRLDEVRRDVLIDMCFNLGITRLLGFRRMLAACKNEDWTWAANEMLASKWAKQVGKRAYELADMMLTGERE